MLANGAVSYGSLVLPLRFCNWRVGHCFIRIFLRHEGKEASLGCMIGMEIDP